MADGGWRAGRHSEFQRNLSTRARCYRFTRPRYLCQRWTLLRRRGGTGSIDRQRDRMAVVPSGCSALPDRSILTALLFGGDRLVRPGWTVHASPLTAPAAAVCAR